MCHLLLTIRSRFKVLIPVKLVLVWVLAIFTDWIVLSSGLGKQPKLVELSSSGKPNQALMKKALRIL